MREAPALSLREAAPSDAAVIDRVTKAAFEEYRGLLDPPSGVYRETLQSVEASLRQGGALLALTAGKTVGALRYHQEDDGSLYIGRLSVLPSHRHRGIGGALVAAVEERARLMGLRRITLGVRDQLTENRAFFESLGYQVDGHHSHPGYSRATVVHMSKTLNS